MASAQINARFWTTPTQVRVTIVRQLTYLRRVGVPGTTVTVVGHLGNKTFISTVDTSQLSRQVWDMSTLLRRTPYTTVLNVKPRQHGSIRGNRAKHSNHIETESALHGLKLETIIDIPAAIALRLSTGIARSGGLPLYSRRSNENRGLAQRLSVKDIRNKKSAQDGSQGYLITNEKSPRRDRREIPQPLVIEAAHYRCQSHDAVRGESCERTTTRQHPSQNQKTQPPRRRRPLHNH